MRINLVGQINNRLTCMKHVGVRNRKNMWLCQCQCGGTTITTTSDFKNGYTKSCGCLHIETVKKHATTHGQSSTNEFTIWQGIIYRCYNKKGKFYKNYGGRGITVCCSWRDSFENFLKDMGLRPSKKHSIDRIDNNGNYEPANCRWATRKEQGNNTRKTIFIKHNGQEKTITEWSDFYKIHVHCLYYRYAQGYVGDKLFYRGRYK